MMKHSAYAAFIAMVCTFLQVVSTDKYLVYIPPDTGSHTIAITSTAKAMIERDHHVTLLVAASLEEHVRQIMANFSPYRLETYSDESLEIGNMQVREGTKHALKGNNLAMIQLIAASGKIYESICDDLLSNKPLIKKLNETKFDLVFANSIFCCSVLIAEYFHLQFVTMYDAIPPSVLFRQHGNPVNPAYNPEGFTGYANQLTFLQRVLNSISSLILWLIGDLPIMPVRCFQHNKVKDKYGIRPGMSMTDMMSLTEVWFINSHFVLDFPRALQPNVITVGGITARSPQPLKADLEQFMQSSGDAGVIVFSMGSYINAMETDKANMIAEAFEKLPQKVLWKLGGEPPSKLPSNVKVSKWLPQNDVLGHPKTRLLIYHCGLNGVFEAIYHAVPVICIPVYNDQWDNAKRIEIKGVGMQLDWFSLSSKMIVEAVDTVIGDRSYQTNMNHLSVIFHDEHLPAAQRVVYWMEKVVRHGGAKHLRPSAALELNSIQHNLIDVMAFIAVVVFIVLAIVIQLAIICYRCCFGCCKHGKGSIKQKSE